MANDQVEEIKRKTDIVALISEYTELKRAGSNFKGLCPFHAEKTPSFMVSPELQIYKCFGCQVGGDVYRFLMDYEKIDFPQALKILADRAGVTLEPVKGFNNFQEKEELYRLNFLTGEFYHFLLLKHTTGETARAYLKNRRIGAEAIETFDLGFAPNLSNGAFNFLTKKRKYAANTVEKAGIVSVRGGNYYDRFRERLIFPLFDHYGNAIGFSGRVIENRGDIAKYINSPDSLVYKKGRVLYGLNIARQEIKKTGYAVLVEGEFDCISCWQSGIKNVVAIKGSALTEDQSELISRFCTRVVLALDADFAGDQAARRGLEIAQKHGLEVRIANLGTYKDPDEAVQANPENFKTIVEQAESVYDYLINSAFLRFDATTTEGKQKISRELIPVLVGIDDEIIRAHCVRLIAERLRVPEDAVLQEVKRNSHPTTLTQNNKEPEKRISRKDLLEERLVSMVFQNEPKLLLDDRVKRVLNQPALSRLVEEYAKSGEYSPSTFATGLPEELKEAFGKLILQENSNWSREELDQEIEQITRELEILQLRDKMKTLSDEIRKLEKAGDAKRLSQAEILLSETSQKLFGLEQNLR